MLINASDLITYMEYGLALAGIPLFICMLVGIFWRVIHIMN